MRIAVIIDAWDPIVGGGQKHVWEICSLLVEKYGYEIDIFTRDLQTTNQNQKPVETYFDGRLRVIRVGPRTSFFSPWGRIITLFTLCACILSENKKRKYHAIHVHVYLGAIVGKLASFITHLPLILTVHGTNLTDMNATGLSAWLEKQICFNWKYNHVIAVGQGYKKYKNNNSEITIISNGVNIEQFDSEPSNKGKDFVILFVGRLEWTKGVDTLINAFSYLKAKYADLLEQKRVKLCIVGYGYDEEKYKKMVEDFHLTTITFKGKLSTRELIKEYKSSNLYVLSSRTEGDSLTIKEAWAAHLPIIATRCNAPEYYVEDGVDGWLVEKENAGVLSEKIAEVLKMNASKRHEVGNKGYEKVTKQFTWDIAAKKTDAGYRHILI